MTAGCIASSITTSLNFPLPSLHVSVHFGLLEVSGTIITQIRLVLPALKKKKVSTLQNNDQNKLGYKCRA